MLKTSSKYLDAVFIASTTSASSSSERDIAKTLSQQNRNKSATRRAQPAPTGIPTTCPDSFAPNRLKMLSTKKGQRITHSRTWPCMIIFRSLRSKNMHLCHYTQVKDSLLPGIEGPQTFSTSPSLTKSWSKEQKKPQTDKPVTPKSPALSPSKTPPNP